MRLFAVHDEAGNIHEVVTCPSDATPVVMTPPQGLSYTECDPPEGLEEDDAGALQEFMKTHRLDLSSTRAVAIRRKNGDPIGGQD